MGTVTCCLAGNRSQHALVEKAPVGLQGFPAGNVKGPRIGRLRRHVRGEQLGGEE